MQTQMELANGQKMFINHLFTTKDDKPKLMTTINGQCPTSILLSNISSITVGKYKEIIVQMNPALGKFIRKLKILLFY